jgi:hypothetical protein
LALALAIDPFKAKDDCALFGSLGVIPIFDACAILLCNCDKELVAMLDERNERGKDIADILQKRPTFSRISSTLAILLSLSFINSFDFEILPEDTTLLDKEACPENLEIISLTFFPDPLEIEELASEGGRELSSDDALEQTLALPILTAEGSLSAFLVEATSLVVPAIALNTLGLVSVDTFLALDRGNGRFLGEAGV